MRKKTIIVLLILTLSIYILNINVQSAAEENNHRPISLELTPHDPIEITSDSNFTDYGFPGTGTVENPYLIDDYNITTTDFRGIYITDTTKHFVISNSYIDANNGIYIDNVAERTATIINNTCSNNNDRSIYLMGSSGSTVSNNTCSNNNIGIWLEDSGSSTVTNNTCSNNNWVGIYLDDSVNSTVVNNTCNNNWEGIDLYFSSGSTVANNTCNNNYYGILLWSSGVCNFINNTCSNNYDYGINLGNSDYCVVTYNLLQENEDYGVYLDSGSDNNLIHHNTFVDNNPAGTSQAYDDGTDNLWYDTATQEGNDWSDWSGTEFYSIDGSASAVDLYPLGVPVIVEYPQIVLLTLLLFVAPLFLTRIISKKSKKKYCGG